MQTGDITMAQENVEKTEIKKASAQAPEEQSGQAASQ